MRKISIITVCLNTESVISKTITSVLNQTYTDYEYLIKDGGSKDETLSISEAFKSSFLKKGIPYRILSQPDSGIYDAMNQAAREASGEWIIYMNAGDVFANQDVLRMVVQSDILNTADVVYGDVIFHSDGWYLLEKGLPIERIRNQMPFCHQSVFTKKQLLQQMGYSLKYRICSDYLFYRERYREGKKFAYLPIPISIFDLGGESANGKLFTEELLRIHEEMGDTDEEKVLWLKEKLKHDSYRTLFHQFFSRFVPERIRRKRWERLREAKGWKRKDAFFTDIN